MSKVKILSEIYSLEKQSEFIVSRFIDNKQRENDTSYTEKRYNKIQNSLVFYRNILNNVKTSEQIQNYNRVKSEIESLTETIKVKSRFAFPSLLTIDEQTKRELDAKIETSNGKRKAILKRVRATEYLLSLGI